jgi:hypothetical protein
MHGQVNLSRGILPIYQTAIFAISAHRTWLRNSQPQIAALAKTGQIASAAIARQAMGGEYRIPGEKRGRKPCIFDLTNMEICV